MADSSMTQDPPVAGEPAHAPDEEWEEHSGDRHDADAGGHGGHGGHHEQSFFHKYMWSTDHKMIAMQYMFTGMAMALIGAFFVYAFRMQLAFPGMSVPMFGQVSPA
jgi:cytochrome c oxidase subunit 1